ncbi:MAG TPA: ankyrin repeat domain-containing protein [bacterium]|nr:ankyrin repeat domain-containing protein [bacterium]
MMKKFFAVAGALILLSVWGCGDGKSAIEKKLEAEAIQKAEEAKKAEEEKAKKAEEEKKKKYIDEDAKPLPPVLESATKKDWGKVKELLASGTAVDTKDERGRTILMLAAVQNNEELFDFLVAKGADTNARSLEGETPLLMAAKAGNRKMVDYLIEKGADPNAKDNFGRTTLMYASASGNVDLVKLFLGKGAELNALDKYTHNALVFAVRENRTEAAKFLLGKGAQVNIVKPLTEEEKKALEEAKKKAEKERKIKEAVYDQTEEKRDKTVLFWAVEHGNLELVKLLVAKGAPVLVKDVKKRVETIIYETGKGDIEKTQEVVEETIRTAYERGQKNLLMYAAEGGHLEVLKFLVSKGAKIEETDGETVRHPLFYVVAQLKGTPEKEKRLAEVTKYLIEEGKKLYKHKRRLSKQEIMQERAKQKNKAWWDKNIQKLQWKEEDRKKIDIEEYDYEGWTLLALAVMNDHFDVFKVLIDAGAQVNRKERKFGKTALMYSRAIKNAEMEKILLEKGAKEGIVFDVDEDARQERIKKEIEEDIKKGKL